MRWNSIRWPYFTGGGGEEISAADPLSYVTKYGIDQEKLDQQFIDPDFTTIPTSLYAEWLGRRAERLAQAGNAFLSELRGSLDK